jgi:hypothetical protein
MKKKFLFLAFVLALAMPLGIALAEDSTGTQPTIPRGIASLKEQIQQRKDANIEAQDALKKQLHEQRCKNIELRIDTRIKRYENNRQMFENVFGNMIARIQRLIDRLKTKGVDTSKLAADLQTLKVKVDKLLADHKIFMQNIGDAKNIACNENDLTGSEVRAKVGEARKVFMTLTQDRLEIRNFYQSNIRPDIMAIRKQLADQKTGENSETTAADAAL